MKKLWAPWRKAYISNLKIKDCIFCSKPKSRSDAASLILERGETVFLMMNLYPYNNGHLLIAPYRHIRDPRRLLPKESAELFSFLNRALTKLEKIIKPKGFNIGMNVGRAAGAGYDKHIHLHIVPRWVGDSNFMPTTSATKVISQSLESFRKLWKSTATF